MSRHLEILNNVGQEEPHVFILHWVPWTRWLGLGVDDAPGTPKVQGLAACRGTRGAGPGPRLSRWAAGEVCSPRFLGHKTFDP